MNGRNFLAEQLLGNAPQPVLRPQQQVPPAPQAVSSLGTQQAFTPISVLNSKERMANSLLEQANDRSVHPIARGLAAYLGTKQSEEINRERTKTESAINQAKQLEEQKAALMQEKLFGLKEREAALGESEAKRKSKFDEDKLTLERDKFNLEKMRDAQDNAFTKVKSADGEVDLLFKGNAPVNDGLEKGMQWGMDKKGNRVAVPIATQPNEKAEQTKELTLAVVDRLLSDKDAINSLYGAVDQYTPNILSGTREAQADLDQLRALLTVDNLSLMSGVLSETDIKILQNVAGGGLAETNSQEGAWRALNDLKKSLSGKPKEAAPKTPEAAVDYTEFFK